MTAIRFDTKQLADILKQPDYAIGLGSLWPDCAEPVTRNLQPAIPWANEREFQRAVIEECDRRAILEPVYGLLYAIPNGQVRRGQIVEPGLRPGMPDLCLPVPSGCCAALYIELKVGSNKPSKAQLDMIAKLRTAGNHVVVVWDSVEEVMRHIEWYLAQEQ